MFSSSPSQEKPTKARPDLEGEVSDTPQMETPSNAEAGLAVWGARRKCCGTSPGWGGVGGDKKMVSTFGTKQWLYSKQRENTFIKKVSFGDSNGDA